MSLVDYSGMEQEIQDAPELKILPKGTEVKARIINVKTGEDKNEMAFFLPIFDVPDDMLVQEFTDFFSDLVDRHKMDEKQAVRAMRKFNVFAEAFGIDFSKPFSFEDFIGLEGWVILDTKKDDYGNKNTVSSYVAK